MGDLSSVRECRVSGECLISGTGVGKHHLECSLCSSMGPAAVTVGTGAAEPLGSIGVIGVVSSDSVTQLNWRCEGPCCAGECPLSSASRRGLKRLLMKIFPQKTRLSQLLWNSLSQSKTICQLNSVSVPCGKITVFPMRVSGYQQHIQCCRGLLSHQILLPSVDVLKCHHTLTKGSFIFPPVTTSMKHYMDDTEGKIA